MGGDGAGLAMDDGAGLAMGKFQFMAILRKLLGFMMGRDGNGRFLENRKKTADTG